MKSEQFLAVALFTVFLVVIFRFNLLARTSSIETATVEPTSSPTLEELAEDGWMKGCIPHTVDEAQKATDVIIDKNIATARARSFCKCDWDYMVNDMGLSLDEIARIGEPDSRGSSAILEAQNICYERNKGGYSQ